MSRGFFLASSSGLHALHPLTKLVYAACIALVALLARWPPLPMALFVLMILPLAVWGNIAGELVRGTLIVTLPLALSVLLVQGFFLPGASQVLFSLGPLSFKQEGLVFAYGTASRLVLLAGTVLLLLYSTPPSDLMLALTERGMPHPIAYMVITAIHLLPQLQARALAILDAQRARGLETHGFLLARMRALVPLLAPLVFSALGDVEERAMALEARAFMSPGAKTSFKELADSRAQQVARWAMVLGALFISVLEMGGA